MFLGLPKVVDKILHKTIINRRSFQRKLDILRAWKYLKYKSTFSHEDADDFLQYHEEYVGTPSTKQQFMECQNEIRKQLEDILSFVKHVDSSLPLSQEMYEMRIGKKYEGNTQKEFLADEFTIPLEDSLLKERNKMIEEFLKSEKSENLENLKILQELEMERMNEMRKDIISKFGFCPYIDISTIKDAGKGLFIEGKCKMGTIIGMYPGLIYRGGDSKSIPKNANVDDLIYIGWERNSLTHRIYTNLENAVYFDTLYNHIVPNDTFTKSNKEKSLKQKIIDWLQGDEMIEKAVRHLIGLRFIHPFALAHYANHPYVNYLPNVVAFPFSVPFNFNTQLLPYIPNKYFYYSSIPNSERLIQTVVLIAKRDLKDEEIFVNYRRNPKSKQSAWYKPVDVEEDWRIWN